jgi:pimeloyl-ACP methyl ester carboxylesterase
MGMTEREKAEVARANAEGKRPVVFVHGLWLLAQSWDRWRALFEEAGFATLAPGWPDDPETVAEARAKPEVFAGKTVKQATDHYAGIIDQLKSKPAIIGHSFGGVITQLLSGRGLASAAVAIDPAPFRGVLPLPFSALRSASAVLANPANYKRAVPLTFEQFRYAFANAVSEQEARELHESFAVPTSGVPIFQAASANLNPWTELKVDTTTPKRGPLLIISGEKDHTVPRAIAHASYARQRKNQWPTEFVEIPNRGHSLTIDSGWHEVADTALAFLKKVQPTDARLARSAAAPVDGEAALGPG